MATIESNTPHSFLWIGINLTLAAAGIIAFLRAILPIGHTSLLSFEASRIWFAATVLVWLILASCRAWYLSNGAGRRGLARTTRTYSVPRRFGLGTILAVTLACGALFTLFRWLQWPAEIMIAILLFFSFISVLQFVFDRAPRQASMLGGSLMLLWPLGSWLFAAPDYLFLRLSDVAFVTACWSVGGAILGYFTGTLIGSVFMMIASARAVFEKRADWK